MEWRQYIEKRMCSVVEVEGCNEWKIVRTHKHTHTYSLKFTWGMKIFYRETKLKNKNKNTSEVDIERGLIYLDHTMQGYIGNTYHCHVVLNENFIGPQKILKFGPAGGAKNTSIILIWQYESLITQKTHYRTLNYKFLLEGSPHT